MGASSTELVFIVDDDADLRDTLADVLGEAGFATVQAANGLQALQYLERGEARPSCILLDLMMPVMDGWEFLRRLERLGDLADIPIIVFTAGGDAAKTARAVAQLRKPPDIDDLLRVVGAFGTRAREETGRGHERH